MTLHDRTSSTAPSIDPLRVVDRMVYSEPAVYEAEQELIFAKTWIFACHRSEISDVGSFFTLDVAGSPIVVVHGQDGEIRAFYNTCRHRGAMVVDEEHGQCRQFRCPYHWWVYDLDGALIGVPAQEAYDYDNSGFDKAQLGLVPVRVEQSHGFVFVCLEEDEPSLSVFLGDAANVLSLFGDAEYEVIKQTRYPMRANWKLYPENSRDGYHVPFVHGLFRTASPPRPYALLDNGHAVQYLAIEQGNFDDAIWTKLRANTLPGLAEGEGFVLLIWPHLLVLVRNNFVMVESVHPISSTETAMQGRVLGLKGDSAEIRDERIFAWETWADTPNIAEDIPVIERQQNGLRSRGVPLILINRGSDNPEGMRGDDNRVRQFWAAWRNRLGTQLNSLSHDFDPTLRG